MRKINLHIEFDENELIDEGTKELMKAQAKAYARNYADQAITDEIKRKTDAAINEFIVYGGARKAIGEYTDQELRRILKYNSDDSFHKMIEEKINDRVERFLDGYEIEKLIKDSIKKYTEALIQNMVNNIGKS